MSNTTLTIRGNKAGLAPPGRLASGGAMDRTSNVTANGGISSDVCADSCCFGDAEAGVRMAYEDKYRKRIRQRKQQRLRNALIILVLSLCLLVFTLYQTKSNGLLSGGARLARKGELPQHEHRQNDDHNKDDGLFDDDRRKHHDKKAGSRGGRARREHEMKEDNKEQWDRLDAYDKSRNRLLQWGNNDGDEEGDEAKIKRLFIELEYLDMRMEDNTNITIRWADMNDVPPLPGKKDAAREGLIFSKNQGKRRENNHKNGKFRPFYQIRRPESEPMAWEKEFDALEDKDPSARPDYVNYVHHTYKYPEKLMEPPELGKYPFMRTYKELMDTWPQDNLDNPPDVLQEDLIHFDWNNADDMEAATKFREAKLPFKVINVPEIMEASKKWTDEYVADNFDIESRANGFGSTGKCNEGADNFFAFFNIPLWDIKKMGLPPTRDNDWTFKRWAKHSVYADRVGLHPHQPHYYWQSGVAREERYGPRAHWSFVSRDLPSFSATNDNFILFHAENQKGIQCRFGERGITAANHYDSGRNMIAMMSGAKRYILSPPRACKRLGVVSIRNHASFRHSMLNYGHMALMDSRDDMPQEEREWLEMAGSAEAVSTVLKEGEILYVPTGWFHYITSLQKSAQCNVRSGPDMEGDAYWGGGTSITEECFPH